MTRKQTNFEDIPMPPHGQPPMTGNERFLPCHRCKDPTLVATLSHYGAMCFRCHEAYCREPLPQVKPRKAP